MFDTKLVDIEKSLEFFSIAPFFRIISENEIKKRYRKLIKLYHPDMHPNNVEWCNDMMQKLNEAYEILINNIAYINSIASENLSKKQKELSVEELEARYAETDGLVEDSVLLGWIQRIPRDSFAINLRNRIKLNVDFFYSEEVTKLIGNHRVFDFFTTLFSVFLRATEFGKLSPFPVARNSTKFLRHFSIANNYLDSGVRNFYRYKHQKKIGKYKNVSLSYLDDAKRLYSYLIPQSNDTQLSRIIQARIELANLFQMRISIQQLWEAKAINYAH